MYIVNFIFLIVCLDFFLVSFFIKVCGMFVLVILYKILFIKSI